MSENEQNWISEEKKLRIGTKDGSIEEFYGRRRFSLKFDPGEIKSFERKMLAGEGTPYTLPMSFLEIETEETVSYDFTGTMQLGDYMKSRILSPSAGRNETSLIPEFLELIDQILCGIKGLEDYLIPYDRLMIQMNTIFIHVNSKKAAFAFVPNDNLNQPLQQRLFQLIEEMNLVFDEQETDQFLHRIKDSVLQNHLGLDGMINAIGMLEREVHFIQWSNKDFRDMDGQQEELLYDESVNANSAINRTGNSNTKPDLLSNKGNSIWKIFDLQDRKRKGILIQLAILASLVILYVSGIFHITDFIGFCAIAAGIDLWLIKCFKLSDSKNMEAADIK